MQVPPPLNVGVDRDVAIVVVHGVGSPPAGETAGTFTSALANVLRANGDQGVLVERSTVQLPLEGVATPATPEGALAGEDMLLHRQLDGYSGAHPDETQTVPVFRVRTAAAGGGAYDVYEGHWGEIGSFGEGTARALVYVARLVTRFFVLGLTSVEAASDGAGSRAWNVYRASQWFLGRLLLGVIPVTSIVFAMAYTAPTIMRLGIIPAEIIAMLLAGVIVLVMQARILFRTGDGSMRDWVLRPIAYGIVVMLLVFLVSFNSGYVACAGDPLPPWYARITPWHALVAEWMLLGLMLIELARRFVTIGVDAERRPGTAPGRAERMLERAGRPTRVITFAGALVLGSFFFHSIAQYESRTTCQRIAVAAPAQAATGNVSPKDEAVRQLQLRAMAFNALPGSTAGGLAGGLKGLQDNLVAFLLTAWRVAFWFAAVPPLLALVFVAWGPFDDERRGQLRETLWTSIVTLSATFVAALLAGAFVFRVLLLDVIGRWFEIVPNASFGPALSRSEFQDLADHIMVFGVVFVGISLATGIWAYFPAIASESRRPRDRWGNTLQLGQWITRGARSLWWISGVSAVILMLAPTWLPWLHSASDDRVTEAVASISGVVWTSLLGAGLAVALTQMQWLLRAARPVLALAADVEIYLRVSPYDRTPRARMLDRLTSLVSFLEREGYRRIIFVAHSQGSALAADTMRLRARNEAARVRLVDDAEAERHTVSPRLSLITVGSPLRQLYSVAFPFLFSWVRGTERDDDGDAHAQRAGLSQWINLYRSGDYVGRWLWAEGTDQERFADQSERIEERAGAGESFDACIGYGGHTGYWSDPAVLTAVIAQTR